MQPQPRRIDISRPRHDILAEIQSVSQSVCLFVVPQLASGRHGQLEELAMLRTLLVEYTLAYKQAPVQIYLDKRGILAKRTLACLRSYYNRTCVQR